MPRGADSIQIMLASGASYLRLCSTGSCLMRSAVCDRGARRTVQSCLIIRKLRKYVADAQWCVFLEGKVDRRRLRTVSGGRSKSGTTECWCRVRSATPIRVALFWYAILAALSGCSGALSPTPPSTPAKSMFVRPDVAGYKLLYSFGGGPAGQFPFGLSTFNGSLYGTTTNGGDSGYGTAFQSSLSGKAKVLHSFRGGRDGSEPYGGLTEFHGSLYGATFRGGGTGCPSGLGCGTVYAINSAGGERIVYRFKPNRIDGWFPNVSPVVLNGSMYGATNPGHEKGCGLYGSTSGCGTIYSIDANGKERVIYRFKGGGDGCLPVALVALKGALYGVTLFGGESGSGCGGPGTVFTVTSSGRERIVHRFNGTPDGLEPNDLIAANGILYGTTMFGGSQTCEGGGRPCGVVFSVTTTGRERVLYAFQGYSDGAGPVSLVALNRELYGTTCCGGRGTGYGTIFKITGSAVKTTLYRFKAAPDGSNPGAITSLNGLLYGITGQGGTGTSCGAFGCGTIYKIAP
jgi:uncharacterized repeat protein (TIGR03803 family)